MDTTTLKSQPGYIIKMVAKTGKGSLLFKLATEYIKKTGASDHWVMCSVPNEPDTLWAFEFFINEDIKAKYEGSELADKFRGEILDLLAEPPFRIDVRPESASWFK